MNKVNESLEMYVEYVLANALDDLKDDETFEELLNDEIDKEATRKKFVELKAKIYSFVFKLLEEEK